MKLGNCLKRMLEKKPLIGIQILRGLAKQVAAKCGGLPLALITIGRAMAYKRMSQDWKYVIEVLKEFSHKLVKMDQQVHPLLKFSYDNLLIDTMRSCLLYCSLFLEDFKVSIDGLIGFWFCEGFLNEFDNISRARMQGYNIINSLLNACLLERDEDVKFVRMHDVIHDMLLWIARIRSIETLDVNWEGVRMSLVKNGIEDLRGTPTYPNLQTLFLSNSKLKELPKGISKLISLGYLDLSFTRIKELPIELNRMEGIISDVATVVGIPHLSPFAKLERLGLRELLALKSIHWNALPFPFLRQIKSKTTESVWDLTRISWPIHLFEEEVMWTF
ncbi:NB-ARC - like 10 [Theobroma cacao]|nr:NB-ARC - like 10 [Theobroma cacao]